MTVPEEFRYMTRGPGTQSEAVADCQSLSGFIAKTDSAHENDVLRKIIHDSGISSV